MKKIAVVFPGQGSQSVGMLADLANNFSSIKEVFQHASQILGYDLWQLIQQGPEEKLNQTQYTQPALLAASVALWQVWQQRSSLRPQFLARHSLGEYSALVCANSLSFEDGIKVVALRGQLMQEAVPLGQGAMAAIIGLEDQQVKQLCQEQAKGAVLSAANFNAIGQVVIAGEKVAVERLVQAATAAGAIKAQLLPVSVPSHCALMKPAATKL